MLLPVIVIGDVTPEVNNAEAAFIVGELIVFCQAFEKLLQLD
jgi:hypothetical protein